MTLNALTKKLKPFENPLRNSLLKWLYHHLPPKPIANKKMHRAYSTAASVLMHARQSGEINAIGARAIADYLSAVIPFIEDFEKAEFPAGSASPEEVLRFLMEQNNLSQYDLARDLGGQSTVSNILLGKRKLSRIHIERLSKRFQVSPATFYPGR